jgi:kinetochore protein Nuf2
MLTCFLKEGLSKDTALASDAVGRTKSRLVRSPERLRRNIDIMGASQAEDKRTLASAEAKIRDLQAKANALLAIEKVRPPHWPFSTSV